MAESSLKGHRELKVIMELEMNTYREERHNIKDLG